MAPLASVLYVDDFVVFGERMETKRQVPLLRTYVPPFSTAYIFYIRECWYDLSREDKKIHTAVWTVYERTNVYLRYYALLYCMPQTCHWAKDVCIYLLCIICNAQLEIIGTCTWYRCIVLTDWNRPVASRSVGSSLIYYIDIIKEHSTTHSIFLTCLCYPLHTNYIYTYTEPTLHDILIIHCLVLPAFE
jgi:hypothetical protein